MEVSVLLRSLGSLADVRPAPDGEGQRLCKGIVCHLARGSVSGAVAEVGMVAGLLLKRSAKENKRCAHKTRRSTGA